MTFSALVRSLGRSRLTEELLTKLSQTQDLHLSGLARLPKGLVASALAQVRSQHLCIITATLEEAGRWAAQLEAMGWATVQFYPTAESSPYEAFDLEAEMTWGQLQVLAELLNPSQPIARQLQGRSTFPMTTKADASLDRKQEFDHRIADFDNNPDNVMMWKEI